MGTLLWLATLFILMLILVVTVVLYEDFPKFQYRLKFCFYVFYLSSVCLLCIPFSIFQPGNVENTLYITLFLKYAAKILGIRYEVTGTEFLVKDEAAIIVCNHQSILDTLAMSMVWPRRCAGVCKKELIYIFPFGLCAWLCGTVFIDRSKGTKSLAQLSETAEVFHKEKTKLWIFPEGTRYKGEELLPFKKGAFHIALQEKLPIQPIVISPYTFIDDTKEAFGQGKLTVSILPPIPTSDITDVNELVTKTRDLMNTEFARLSSNDIPRQSSLISDEIK